MRIKLIFEGDQAELVMVAEDEFEKKMLGVIAGGEGRVCDAMVECEARAHWTHGTIDKATIRLKRGRDQASIGEPI